MPCRRQGVVESWHRTHKVESGFHKVVITSTKLEMRFPDFVPNLQQQHESALKSQNLIFIPTEVHHIDSQAGLKVSQSVFFGWQPTALHIIKWLISNLSISFYWSAPTVWNQTCTFSWTKANLELKFKATSRFRSIRSTLRSWAFHWQIRRWCRRWRRICITLE